MKRHIDVLRGYFLGKALVAVGMLGLFLVSPQLVRSQESPGEVAIHRTYDVVVANILADVIIDLLDQGVPAARPGGLFICSGIIEAYQARVAEKMAACGFDIVDVRKEGDWVALVGRREA